MNFSPCFQKSCFNNKKLGTLKVLWISLECNIRMCALCLGCRLVDLGNTDLGLFSYILCEFMNKGWLSSFEKEKKNQRKIARNSSSNYISHPIRTFLGSSISNNSLTLGGPSGGHRGSFGRGKCLPMSSVFQVQPHNLSVFDQQYQPNCNHSLLNFTVFSLDFNRGSNVQPIHSSLHMGI